MGFFDAAKGAISGNKAYKLHVDAGKLVDEGKVAQAEEKYRQAQRLYEESVRLGNETPKILLAYAVLLMRLGEFERAREIMLKMSKLKGLTDADWYSLRLQFSIYQWRTGDVDKAIETIGRAASNGMNGMIYSTLGMYHVDKAKQTGDFAPALAFNREALDYDDEDASTLDNLGQLYEAMADAEESTEQAEAYRKTALGYYEKAHEVRPRQITTIYYMARMLHQSGDDAGARKLLSDRDSLYVSAVCPITREMMDQLAGEIG